jgi:hypothetical protein
MFMAGSPPGHPYSSYWWNEEDDKVEQVQPLQDAHVMPAENEPDDRAVGNDRPDLGPVPSKKAQGESRSL